MNQPAKWKQTHDASTPCKFMQDLVKFLDTWHARVFFFSKNNGGASIRKCRRYRCFSIAVVPSCFNLETWDLNQKKDPSKLHRYKPGDVFRPSLGKIVAMFTRDSGTQGEWVVSVFFWIPRLFFFQIMILSMGWLVGWLVAWLVVYVLSHVYLKNMPKIPSKKGTFCIFWLDRPDSTGRTRKPTDHDFMVVSWIESLKIETETRVVVFMTISWSYREYR